MKSLNYKFPPFLLAGMLLLAVLWSVSSSGSVPRGTVDGSEQECFVLSCDTSSEAKERSVYQERMDKVVNQLLQHRDIQGLNQAIKKVDVELQGFYKAYWKSYLYYYEAVYYKTIEKKEKKAEEAILMALHILEEKSYENSEYYALLAACTSFSMPYVNIIKLSKVSSNVLAYAQKALALNKANLRAYEVLASHNFHTPKMFGGMEKVEEYALKGLACPDALDATAYTPSWGRVELYSLLIQYYKLEGRTSDLEQIQRKYATQS
ncbi:MULTISPECIES: hypothetical protein [unclassified Myroides]|uniref:hypothetical protein n=1 Tax=unclassified Myroides TaxID=2642485 RepID=UPI003D2F6559